MAGLSHDPSSHADMTPPTVDPSRTPSGLNVGRNVLTTLVGNLFPPISALMTAPVLAHALGVAGRGELAAAMAPYLLLTTVAVIGIPEAATYSIARQSSIARWVTRRGVAIVAALGLAAVGALIPLAGWLGGGQPHTTKLIILAAIAITPALCLGVVRGTASGLHLWRIIARERLITSAARLLGIGGLAVSANLTPTSATLIMVITPVIGGLAYVPMLRTISQPPTPATGTLPRFNPILRYGIKVWLGAISGILLVRVDQALLTPLAGSLQLGLYVVAVTVGEIPLVVNSAVRDVTFATESKQTSVGRVTAAARISSSACMAIGALLLAVTPLAVPVVFGNEFRAAVPATIILLIATMVGTPGSVAGAGLSGRGRPELRSASLIVACVVNFGLLLMLVPDFGAIGAAWATLAGNLLSSNLNIVFMHRLYDIPVKDFFGLRRSDIRLLRTATLSFSTRRAE